jgi:hypothetical protein
LIEVRPAAAKPRHEHEVRAIPDLYQHAAMAILHSWAAKHDLKKSRTQTIHFADNSLR